MFNINKEIKKQLGNGIDAEARADLVADLETLCENSRNGEIGIGGFVDTLAEVLENAKEYFSYWRESGVSDNSQENTACNCKDVGERNCRFHGLDAMS